MPVSLTDLAGLRVGVEDFLAAVLETAGQPIWVVDPDDVIRFANPAAIEALGYGSAEELFGHRSHDTIHYKHRDGTPYPAAECPMMLPRATGETVARDLDWFVRRDGSMFPVSYVSAPIEMPDGRGAVVAFRDIEDRLRAEQVLREHDALLAAREGSLQRIAALVAGGATSAEVFPAIASEVGHVIGLPLVALWRYEPDGTATVIGAWSEHPHPFRAGTRWPLDGPGICAQVLKTGRPARDRGLRRRSRHDRRRRPQDRNPRVRRRADHRRRRRLGRDVDRLDKPHAPARPHRGPARRVHGAGRHGDLEDREPRRARPARGRADGAAARGHAGRA
ncbi:MAG TPA: PAS domain S-box protein [Candidatus Limnocylindrales bacterium]|nr:PAS domain S-box protein [Candidatus Limnocylindrales bacterium]